MWRVHVDHGTSCTLEATAFLPASRRYRLLDNPEGPSFTTGVCPKFTPLGEFTNNTAHSNMFYGLRIHPEYYPRNNPCNGFSTGTFDQSPAVFSTFTAYKNGMKGAIGTQVGAARLVSASYAQDCGPACIRIAAGPWQQPCCALHDILTAA